MSPRTRPVGWASWLAIAVVAVAALAFGSMSQGEPTTAERARNLQESVRCPQCASQAVAHSDTPSARGVKVVIDERIAAGNTDEEIRDFIASRYGRDVLLDPAGSGFSGLVWALPVIVALVAVAGLVHRFGDWRPGAGDVSDADRDLVERALGRRREDPGA